MTKNGLRQYLTDECTNIEVECTTCEAKFKRENFAAHDCK